MAGRAIDDVGGCRSASGDSSGRSGKVAKPHTWPVCAKIAKVGKGEREPTQGITFGAGH